MALENKVVCPTTYNHVLKTPTQEEHATCLLSYKINKDCYFTWRVLLSSTIGTTS